MAESFTLSLASGELLVRGAEEPYALSTGTTIAGTVDTGEGGSGAITGATFSSPPISFETVALGFPVAVDATFSQVAPGSAIGAIDHEGKMFVQTSLTVDLHIEVGNPVFLKTDCRSTPVNITLESTSPYTPGEGDTPGRVTLTDPDFTIPEIPAGPCDGNVRPSLNEMLAGAGHSLVMTVEGDIELPPEPKPPATATLSVSPEGGVRTGDPVTMTAAVVPGPDAESSDVPTGFVDFRDGATVLATTLLEADGTAELVTSTLSAGVRNLSVRYRGDGNHGPTTSEAEPYLVAARPGVLVGVPDFIELDAAPVTFPVTVRNTGLGSAIEGARADITLKRVVTNQGTLTPAQVVLERRVSADPEVWEAVTLAQPTARTLVGSLGLPADLAPGATRTETLRIKALAGASFGATNVFVEVLEDEGGLPVPVAAPAPAAVASGMKQTTIVEANRRDATLTFGGIGTPPVSPAALRQGYTARVSGTVGPALSGVRPTGTLEFVLGGRVLQVRPLGRPTEDGLLPASPILANGAITTDFNVPVDLPPGPYDLVLRYSGDVHFKPNTYSTPMVVQSAIAPLYDCFTPGTTQYLFRAQIQAQANIPVSRPAGAVPMSQVDVRMTYARSRITDTFGTTYGTGVTTTVGSALPSGTLEGIGFTFGPSGTGTAQAITRNGTAAATTDTAVVDQEFLFGGETGTLAVDGAPGEVVPITLDSVVLRARVITASLPFVTTCTPVAGGTQMGAVTVAGTSLTVEGPDHPREGDEVVLTVAVEPSTSSGFVEFTDDGETIGVVPVVDGTAAMATTDLAVGSHPLQARYFGGVLDLSTSSAVEVLVVDDRYECPAAAEAGNGAVVRLVYLELLGRCPDPVGYHYWVGRLDGGTSPEVFARSIARTPEAVGRVVDDAYRTMLGRSADGVGRAFWTGRLLAHGRYDVLLADLGGSEEFWSRAGSTNAGFVARVYERLLGRVPDQAGQDYWVGRLGAGTPRRALVKSLATLAEPLGVIVTGSYGEILSRRPTPAELSDGIALLRRSGDRSGLYAQLIGTEEFFARAQGFPNPED